MTTFYLDSSHPINDCKLWLICFDETSMKNCSSENQNNTMLWALPFIQVTVKVILHNYSKIPLFTWKFEKGILCQNVTKSHLSSDLGFNKSCF